MATPTKKKRKPVRKKIGFTIPGTETKMDIRSSGSDRHPDAPNARPYVFDPDQVRQIAVGLRLDMNIALTGPTGCGKTTLPTMLAAAIGQPMIRFNCHGETRVSTMVGIDRPAVKDGVLTLQFSERALVKAMRGGYWVLFDEIDAALASVAMVLQSVMEEGNRRLFVPELDEEILAHENFRVFATGNTIGYRSLARASHAGTNPLNDAFLDRFGMVIACDYPGKAQEVERMKVNVPDVHPVVVEMIGRVAEEVRSDEKFKSDFSTRRCVQWARLTTELGHPRYIFEAADLCVVRKMRNPTDAAVFKEVLQRTVGREPT
jgi:midasin